MSESELMKIIREAAADVKQGEHVCRHCNRGFVKESTLQVHQCEPKRRAQQQNEKGVIIGFTAWLRFFEISQGSAKLKTYEDFCNSQYYNAFVKFGRHCVSISAVNVNQFVEYVLRKQVKIDRWCHDRVYSEYLQTILRTEQAADALERSILTMQEWAEETNNALNEYYNKISGGRLVQHVQNGRISPWAIYCSSSAIARLETLNEEELALLMPYIDPDFWQKRMKDYPADTELSRYVLTESGI